METMLQLRGVSKTFNPHTPDAVEALHDVDLGLAPGEFATIIGSNGAGKSTLFNAITGAFLPDAGSIMLDGHDVTYWPAYRRAAAIGRLFQDPLKGTAPHMTIQENLALAYMKGRHGGPFSRLTAGDRQLFAARLAELGLGLEDHLDQPVGLLSGGQRQALTLLMATLVTPRLLLLDEHTAALDPATAAKVLDLTNRVVAAHGISCLMVTHNIQTALQMGSRTIMMAQGRIVLDLSGAGRQGMTRDRLVAMFRQRTHHELDSDRILLD